MAEITPVVESVLDNGDGTYTATFGYISTYTENQDISIGSSNGFFPLPTDRGQPTTFLPGTQTTVFSITWDGSELTWNLDGLSVSANASQSVLQLSSLETVIVLGSSYYSCNQVTGLVWVRSPGVEAGDNLVLMAVAATDENVLDTDSSIKLELLREGGDFRLVYFTAQSQLVNRSILIDLLDGAWHFLSYESMANGYMRFSVDGVELPASADIDDNGLPLAQARSQYVRPGGGSLWTPYLYKAGQSIFLYNLRFGVGFNLGLPWIRELMEIDKRKLRID